MVDYIHIGVGVPDLAAAARRLRDMGFTIYSDGLGGKTPLDPDNLEQPAFKVEDPDGITVDVSEVHHHVAGHDDSSEPDGSAGSLVPSPGPGKIRIASSSLQPCVVWGMRNFPCTAGYFA